MRGVYPRPCVVGWVGFRGFFVTIERSPGLKEMCASLHGVLSNTNNSAVKPLYSVKLREVWQKVKEERKSGDRYRVRRYHGEIIKKAESGGEMLHCYHYHLRSL